MHKMQNKGVLLCVSCVCLEIRKVNGSHFLDFSRSMLLRGNGFQKIASDHTENDLLSTIFTEWEHKVHNKQTEKVN